MPYNLQYFANLLIRIEKMFSKKSILGIILWLLLTGLSVTLVTTAGLYLYLAPKLPSVDSLRQVQLQTPLRIYSSDHKLIGEFGEQRRTPLTYEQIPPLYLKALLSAEDAEFFSHHGVSLKGMLRAASQILKSGAIQSGGSTITQQLARDFFLSRDQKFTRKINEILLSVQIERRFTKEEILELFNNKINQIFIEQCHRKPYNIGIRTFNFNNTYHTYPLLNAVGTCFVERVEFGVIVQNQSLTERLENHMRDDVQLALDPAIAGESHPGADLVSTTGKPPHHRQSLLQVRRLAQRLPIDVNQRVRADHQRTGLKKADHKRLPAGIFHRELLRCQRGIMRLLDLRHEDLKIESSATQQLNAPW